MSKIEIVVNGEKLWFDYTLFLKEKEYRIIKERPLIPSYMWSMYGLDEETLNDIRNSIKEENDNTRV